MTAEHSSMVCKAISQVPYGAAAALGHMRLLAALQAAHTTGKQTPACCHLCTTTCPGQPIWCATVDHSASDRGSRSDAQDSERILALPKEGSCVLEIIASSAMLCWGIIRAARLLQ